MIAIVYILSLICLGRAARGWEDEYGCECHSAVCWPISNMLPQIQPGMADLLLLALTRTILHLPRHRIPHLCGTRSQPVRVAPNQSRPMVTSRYRHRVSHLYIQLQHIDSRPSFPPTGPLLQSPRASFPPSSIPNRQSSLLRPITVPIHIQSSPITALHPSQVPRQVPLLLRTDLLALLTHRGAWQILPFTQRHPPKVYTSRAVWQAPLVFRRLLEEHPTSPRT